MAGAVLYREGDDRPLTIASAEAVADGPGWRVRFREVATRDAADALRGRLSRSRSSARPRTSAAGRTTGTRSSAAPCAASMAPSSGRSGTSTGSARPRSSSSTAGRTASFDLPAVRAFIRIFAPRRGEIVVDAESLDLRPPRSRAPDPERPKAPRRRTRRTTPDPTVTERGDRRRREPEPRRRPSHDARDRRPDAVPGDGRRPARREHPRADPGAGPRRDPDPRPARVGHRPAPVRRRRAVRRRSGDDPAAGAGRGRARRAAPPGLDRRSCSTRSARSSARRAPRTSPTRSHLIFVCPRYEGVDERIRSLVDLELSIGDYVLTGGELPALVVIDAVIRLLPGAIEDASTVEESFADGPARVPAVHAPARLPRRWTCRRS